MTRLKEIEERLKAIKGEIELDGADISALNSETDALLEERTKLIESEQTRKATLEKIASLPVEEADTIIEKETKTMTELEIRGSVEYGKAYLKSIKTGDVTEVRSLLSGNASGQIPVPTALENEIKNAWETAALMGLVKKSYYPGNVKVGFELSATGASVHAEGTAAPEEEVLTIGTVELKPENIKKWITVSDEAIEGTTVDTIGYLYNEIAQRIVEKAEEILVAKITTASSTGMTATSAGAAVYTAATLAVDTITMALAELSGKAKNVTLAMNRRTYAAFIAAAKANKYAVDPFDGCKVVFTDALKAFSAASTGDTYVIAGDFGYGFQANFPNGNSVVLKKDDLSLAEKDLVKIVGRQFVGMDVVAPKAFVCIQK